MSKKIEISCQAQPKDVLEVMGNKVDVLLRATQTTDAGEHETYIYLDEERARTLFNWLGVWLHGGNRS